MNDYLELITFENIVNEVGNTIKNKKYKGIFANKKSITQNEFYQAEQLGLKLSNKFEIYFQEYNNELFARYNNKEYKIIRTYQVDADKLEIVLEGVKNGNG